MQNQQTSALLCHHTWSWRLEMHWQTCRCQLDGDSSRERRTWLTCTTRFACPLAIGTILHCLKCYHSSLGWTIWAINRFGLVLQRCQWGSLMPCFWHRLCTSTSFTAIPF